MKMAASKCGMPRYMCSRCTYDAEKVPNGEAERKQTPGAAGDTNAAAATPAGGADAMDRSVQMRTKPRNKRTGLDNLDTNSLARPSSHHGQANGVHKRDSSVKRHSKGPHDVPDADTRSVASGTSNRPKHKGPPAHGYRKKDGGKKK
ncbi:hypothetical protein NP493_698g01005 [Ridgeia piscesae]|uniref:Uncharacterized protein n=1 Tax=Ridgeia piscesae TaxID=27915 RepID=A0AAD9NMX3_RIDPI|nr:hypothetical protein NP493_698g01005 [Ridgeia piscesae]